VRLRPEKNNQLSWNNQEELSLADTSLFWKRSLKSAAATVAPGWAKQPFKRAEQRDSQVLILAYHRVVASLAQAERDSIYGLVISAESFARHLEIVQERYDVLSMDEALQVFSGKRQGRRPAAVITFDDGYRDVYDNAWPVLQRMNLPAIVYVPTAFMGSNRILDHDRLYWLVLQARAARLDLTKPLEDAGLAPPVAARLATMRPVARVADALNYHPFVLRQAILQRLETALRDVAEPCPSHYELMSWAMIKEMANGGISFGAHSDHHLILTLESEASVDDELRRSKQRLEEQLQRPIRHFAYPNGYFNSTIKDMVARAGFASAVTTERVIAKRGDDTLALGRISLCEESTRGISGEYSEAIARLRLAA
jgi:peptidoglycan/xylan/chitin deacetylase (PgdA/CDA1 family)